MHTKQITPARLNKWLAPILNSDRSPSVQLSLLQILLKNEGLEYTTHMGAVEQDTRRHLSPHTWLSLTAHAPILIDVQLRSSIGTSSPEIPHGAFYPEELVLLRYREGPSFTRWMELTDEDKALFRSTMGQYVTEYPALADVA